jgi:RNA polymerase sigma-70 factor (sigma-E family)
VLVRDVTQEAAILDATADAVETTRQDEFGQFMAARWPGLVRLAYALTGDRWLAEDVAQAALASAYAAWWRVRRADDPDAYVRRILVNTSHRRFRRRRVAEQAREPAELPDLSVADPADLIGQRSALLSALRELPRRQRAVVVLRYWEDLSDAQVAASLGCAEGTVRSQASRALAKLRGSTALADGAPGAQMNEARGNGARQ